MALQFIDGFDYYTNLYYNWNYSNGGASIAITTTDYYTINPVGPIGSLAIGGSTANIWLQRYITTATTTIIGFAIKFKNLSYQSFQILQLGNSGIGPGFTNVLALGWNNTTAGLDIYDPIATPTPSWTGFAPLFPITINKWYYIEWHNANGTQLLYMNEKLYWATTKTFSPGSINAVGFGTSISLANSNYYIDDLYIMDGTTNINNGPIGNSKVTTILPASNSNIHAWTPLSGINYAQINSVPDNSATYVYTSTTGTNDIYNYPSLTSIPAYIYGVKVNTIGRKSIGTLRQIKSTMLENAVTSGIATTLSESYGNSSVIFQARPSTGQTFVSMGPQALAIINATQYGFTLTT